jgi:hypothetical protein
LDGTRGDASDDEGPKPTLPPRRPAADLLGGDEGDARMSRWKALEPN